MHKKKPIFSTYLDEELQWSMNKPAEKAKSLLHVH